MPAKDHLLIDTNVMLDYILRRQHYYAAMQLFNLAYHQKVKCYISALSFSNSYYVCSSTYKIGHNIIMQIFNRLLTFIEVLPITGQTIQQAIKANFRDFEDALQNQSALQKSSVQFIITRNVKDFKHTTLIVLEPQDYLALRRSS